MADLPYPAVSEFFVADPLSRLRSAPAFAVTSEDVADGAAFAPAQMSAAMGVAGGEDRSPQLSWSGAPAATKSFAVTIYDPDAPTLSGFWHWAVLDIPADVTSLPAGAGAGDGAGLPPGARQLANDLGMPGYIGAAPPAGHGPHRYVIVVDALDVASLGLPPGAAPSALNFVAAAHVVGRATMTVTAEIAAG